VSIKLKVCTCGYTFHPKSHRQPPKCDSIPIATLKFVTSHEEVVTDSDPVCSVEVQSQPIVTSKPGTSQKWKKYKDNINKKRREKYMLNSQPAKTHFYKLYHKNPELSKSQKRVSYNLNPSPIKERTRQNYSLNPSPVKAHKREMYRSNQSPVKECIRQS